MTTIGSLFSGIGLLEAGLMLAGLGPVIWQVESDPFCRRVLGRHYPATDRSVTDVRNAGAANLVPVDLICGGFPCQDVSSAGNRAGLAGERSGLWFEFARVVSELRPLWVVVENVASGARAWVDSVVGWLVGAGYHALPLPVSASDCGAPHRRARVFVVARLADADSVTEREPDHETEAERNGRAGARANVGGCCGGGDQVADAVREGLEGYRRAIGDGAPQSDTRCACGTRIASDRDRDREPIGALDGETSGVRGVARTASTWPAPPRIRGMGDGGTHRVDRLMALGNAVVPQCAEVVGWVIRELEASA